MNRGNFIRIAASSLVIGVAATGTSGIGSAIASPSAKSVSVKSAASLARQASKMLEKRRPDKAVRFAEAAVAAAPGNGAYRALLGQAYLASGRFESARAVLADAVALDPSNDRAALNLALAQTAMAQNDAALATLESAKAQLAPADHGLALALAGNVDGALAILEAAARAPDASVKSRQNLALVYAMANRWGEARTVAAQDLPPDTLDQRMTDWVRFVRPAASWDQVASLLGVTPAWDPGMPVALAMARPTQPAQEVAASPEPAPAPPVETVAVEAPSDLRPGFEVVSAESPAPTAPAAQPAAIVPVAVQAPVAEAPIIRADPAPVRQAVRPVAKAGGFQRVVKTTETGNFVVQLGAFSSEARAQAAWRGASRRIAALSDFEAAMPRVRVNSASLYRLSVSGFATRASAGQVCARVKAAGGQCFVRSVTDAKPVQWAARGGKRIASR